MRITTETGSVYDLSGSGICVKTNAEGRRVDSFKPFTVKPVPDSVHSWQEVHEIPNGDPVVGQRMYISGLNTWWLTTPVVSIEE
jgi:hypothetical protein